MTEATRGLRFWEGTLRRLRAQKPCKITTASSRLNYTFTLTVNHLQDAVVALDVREHVAHADVVPFYTVAPLLGLSSTALRIDC